MACKWQVWTYSWSYVTTRGPVPIPETLCFGGKAFDSKKEAKEAWYDTIPGRNDHAVYLPAKEAA